MLIEGGHGAVTDTIMKSMGRVTDDILTVTLPDGALDADASLYVELLEETGPELQSRYMQRRKNALYVGQGDSGFLVRVINATSLREAIEAELTLDTAELRKAGGCYTTETTTATICVPAYVGLYNYIEEFGAWRPTAEVDTATIGSTSVTLTTSTITDQIFSAQSSPQCCDYDGLARSCGDKVCLKLGQAITTLSPGKLGDGTRSKMPTIAASTRPGAASVSDLQSYQQKSSSGSVEYTMRSGWSRVCLRDDSGACVESKTDWFSARFLHAVQAVSATRVLIFGGECAPALLP
jgi:hypothetical protein